MDLHCCRKELLRLTSSTEDLEELRRINRDRIGTRPFCVWWACYQEIDEQGNTYVQEVDNLDRGECDTDLNESGKAPSVAQAIQHP